MERSVEMIVGLMGILKAGGAVVPMDPEYPATRIQLYMEDSGAAVMVTTQVWASRNKMIIIVIICC